MTKKKQLLTIIVCLLTLIATACSSKSNTTAAGKYTASNGSYIIITNSNSWHGEIKEKSISTGIDWEYSYKGTLNDKNELVITKGETRRVMPGGAVIDGGDILGELVGNEIHSGGLILRKQSYSQSASNSSQKQYKRVDKKSVSYVQIYGDKVIITTTRNKYDVSCLEFKKDGFKLIGQNGASDGKIFRGLFGVRILGIKDVSGFYRRGDYTYNTGAWPDE